MRGIRLVIERGLPRKLKTVAVTINKHELWSMKRFAQEELGLEFRFDAMINPRIDCSRAPLAVRLTPQEVVELDLDDPKRCAEWRRFAQKFCGAGYFPDHRDQLYHCGGGVSSFAVDPYGNLSICTLSQRDRYDLRAGSFQEGWDNYILWVRQKKTTRMTECVTCGIKPMCGMCPANGELENGDPEEPVDFLCQVAHLRAYALGIRVPPHGDCEYCEGGSSYRALMGSVSRLLESMPPNKTMSVAQGGEVTLGDVQSNGSSSVFAGRAAGLQGARKRI